MASSGARVSTDTSKKVPLQQRRGSKVTVRTLLPICRRCARNLSEIIARMVSPFLYRECHSSLRSESHVAYRDSERSEE